MADITKLESFKLITLEEFKNWECYDKLVAQYSDKLYNNDISNYLIEGISRASLQLDSICGYRLETEFPLLDPNSDNDKERIKNVKIACCLQTQYLIRTGIEYSSGGENSSDGVASYTYPSNMKIEFSPDVISLLEKAKFYKSQTITKINPDNYGFKNEYHTWIGRPDTNHKDRPFMLSEADGKYVWKNSIFKSNTLSIIPWADTEKSGIWQIEISQELLAKYIDNYIKNVSIKVDNKSVVYNSNNELSVPFDNETIYEENGIWKAKQGGDIPSDVIKDSDLNKDYIDKQDGKYIVKTSQDINLKQDKLISGTNIKTINGNSLLGNGDISISGGNNWEVVNTDDFKPNDTQYILPITPNGIYKYKVELGYLKENKTIYKSSLIFSEKNFDKNYDVVVGNTFQFSGLPIFTISISLRKGYQNAIINLLNQNGVKHEMQTLSIERKRIKYSNYNNTELMSDEPHSIYKRDMDTYLPKETLDSYDIVIRKINSATTINELNLIEKHPIWRIISNNRNDIKELFNKKWLELNKKITN